MNKKKKPVYFEEKFILGLYKARITFAFGDFEKYSTMLMKKYGLKKENKPLGNVIKISFENGNQEYILWLKRIDYGALAHEAAHLANYIFEDRRIFIGGFREDEPFAFLVEWIVNEYLEFVKRSRKKLNR
jgi:hypothetical protein